MRKSYLNNNILRAFIKHGIACSILGVYKIIVGILGLLGVGTAYIAHALLRRTMKNRSVETYLLNKKYLPQKEKTTAVFVTDAPHPHKRPHKIRQELKPIETPSYLQDRDAY